MGTTKSKKNRTNITRSRGGCQVCKKLKIKCDQNRPKCEYCNHRNRECVYPMKVIAVEFKESPHEASLTRFNGSSINQLNLNNATSQLGVSKFELRLLHFFSNHCILVNETIHAVWTDKISPLFLQSELIRNSIYSYAALNMFQLCGELDNLRIQDELDSQLKFRNRIGLISFPDETQTLVQDTDDLHFKTTQYFIKAISDKNHLLNKLQSIDDKSDQIDENNVLSTELIVSSILMASFLTIHSYRLLPLVSFDRSETDFISMCKGISQTVKLCDPMIKPGLFTDLIRIATAKGVKSPTLQDSQINIIVRLRQDLEFEYANPEHEHDHEYQVLYEALEVLQSCVHQAMTSGYLFPLFKWISLTSFPYLELIYSKNFFAIRLLYVYSCLGTLTKFQTHQEANIWLDFIRWYRSHNYELYQDWKYATDKSLYFLVVNKDFTDLEGNFSKLQDFDPELSELVI